MAVTAHPLGQPGTVTPGASLLQRASRVLQRASRVLWLWPSLLAVILGSYQLSRPELWRDELSSWSFASRPVPDLIATVRHTDATDLLYYLLLHCWIAAFGDSVAAMRSMSVLAMGGAAACVTLAGRRLASPRAGLLAGLAFALVPSVSRFAQEIRSYAFEALAGTLAVVLLLRALDKPGLRRWAAYGACVAVLGYVDLVALAVLGAHAALVALRWWRDRDNRLLAFAATAAAGLAACLPLIIVASHEAGGQVGWILRPGLDLPVFSSFARNLFYSTSVAAAFILLAALAWAVDRQAAAAATALAVLPVGVVWLVSQGPHSYFFPRYILLTVGAWAMLAGIGLARVDVRMAAAAIVAIAVFGAGDQQVIRTAGAHNWAYYPAGAGGTYPDYAGAARVIARQVRVGDGIVYPAGAQEWQMIGLGVQYYLEQDLRHGSRVPQELFLAPAAAQLHHLFPVFCAQAVACLGQHRRTWVVVSGDTASPYADVLPAQAAALAGVYRASYRKPVGGMTVFLLVERSSTAIRGPSRSAQKVLLIGREQVAAGRVQAQAHQFAPGRADVPEDAGQPGRPVDVDGVLIAAATERHVRHPPGQVRRTPAVRICAVRGQPDPGRADHDQRGPPGQRFGGRASQEAAAVLRLDQHRPVLAPVAHPDRQFAGQAGEPGHERAGRAGVNLLRRAQLDQPAVLQHAHLVG
jgi:mannosyltransferase